MIEEGKTIRIVLVDDQLLYREGLRGLFDHWPEFEVVGEASNGREAIDECQRLVPDLVLMDLQMPVMNGVESARAIHAALPDTAIVMLTVATNEELIFSALDTGVKGYLLKDTPARQLRSRLHGILQGEMALSGAVTTSVVGELARLRERDQSLSEEFGVEGCCESASAAMQLTQRELDILRCVAQGKSNEEISAELYLSLGTVKKQLGVIMQRLYVENRVQLAVYATKHKLID